MNNYIIKVRAKNETEAQSWVIERVKKNELDYKYFIKVDEQTNWHNEAEKMADDIFEEKKNEMKEIVEKSDMSDVDNVCDKIYQEMDLVDICHEWCDGKFIYNDNESIKEALDCIKELYDFEETDSGLWEGLKTIEEVINAKAFWTFRNAVFCKLEEKIKGLIVETFSRASRN